MKSLLWMSLLAAQPIDATRAVPETSPIAKLGMRLGVEFAVGPYRPDVDAEFSDATPYADIFGSSTALMYRLRLHAFIPTALGEVGVTAGVGWFTDSANALAADGSLSAGETGVRLIPVSLLLRWRTEALGRWPGLPLALTVAGGLNYTFWRITKGDGGAAEFEGIQGDGGTLSAQVEGAVGLRLGQLDGPAAKRLKQEFGIDDTELGVAVSYVSEPIGWWDALHVGDFTWQAYLSVGF